VSKACSTGVGKRWRRNCTLCRLLADGTNRRILAAIAAGSSSPAILADRTGIPIQSVRKHLSRLVSAELVSQSESACDNFQLANARVSLVPGSALFTLGANDGSRLVVEFTDVENA
jgi:DNA-binding transcriptional ArsR family regulator